MLLPSLSTLSLNPLGPPTGVLDEEERNVYVDQLYRGDWSLKDCGADVDDACDDPVLVITAVTRNGLELQYASPALRTDRNIVLAAVKQNGNALQYASYDLRTDRDVVLAAVTQNGNALQFVWQMSGLRDDPAVVVAAVLQNPEAAVFAGYTFFDNPELWLTPVRDNENVLKGVLELRRRRIIKFSDELILEVVKRNGNVMKFVPEYLREKADFRWAAATADLHPQFDLMKLILGEIMDTIVETTLPEEYQNLYTKRQAEHQKRAEDAGEVYNQEKELLKKRVLPNEYRPGEYESKAKRAESKDKRAEYEAKHANWLRPYEDGACDWVDWMFNNLVTVVMVLDRELDEFKGNAALREQLEEMQSIAANHIIPYLLDPIRTPCDRLKYKNDFEKLLKHTVAHKK
jgi:hypothetical protein